MYVSILPKRHERYIRNFRPISNSLCIEFLGWLRGKKAEHIDAPKTLAKAEGRKVTRVRAMELLSRVPSDSQEHGKVWVQRQLY